MIGATAGAVSSTAGLGHLSSEFDTWLGPVQIGHITAADGHPLAYQTFGDGPAVLLANGIGITYPGLALQIADLRRDHRVICWDYRGMGESVAEQPPPDITIDSNAADGVAILDHLGIDRVIYVGFSMGVQVGLELLRSHPQRIEGFVAMMGCHCMSIRNVFPGRLGMLAENSVRLGVRVPQISQIAMDLCVAFPERSFALLSTLSVIQPKIERPILDFHLCSMASQDRRLYNRTLLALSQHDASDVLPEITCPTLVISAEHDVFTPAYAACQMADAIPGATYRLIKDGSHLALCERPEAINGWIRELIDQVRTRG